MTINTCVNKVKVIQPEGRTRCTGNGPGGRGWARYIGNGPGVPQCIYHRKQKLKQLWNTIQDGDKGCIRTDTRIKYNNCDGVEGNMMIINTGLII
jgi:hypothetical protein